MRSFIAGLLLLGCGASASPEVEFRIDELDLSPRWCPDDPILEGSADFTIRAERELSAFAECAARRWGRALGVKIDVVSEDEDATIHLYFGDTKEGRASELIGTNIRIKPSHAYDSPEELTWFVLHELGHYIAHRSDHIERLAGVMGPTGINRITLSDVKFVCKDPRFECRWIKIELRELREIKQ